MYKTTVYMLVNGVITHKKKTENIKQVILLSSTLTLRQFHVGFRLFGTRRVRVRVRAKFRGRFRRQQIIDS